MALGSANARSELVGARLRDNERAKRYPVSGWIGQRGTAVTMRTSPTSSAFGKLSL